LTRFDLTAAAAIADASARPRLLASLAIAALLLIVAAYGIYLLVTAPKTSDVAWAGLLVIPLGSGAVGTMILLVHPRPAPRTLTVDSERVSLQDIPGRGQLSVPWTDPHLRMTVFDFREFPAIGYDGKPRTVDFMLQLPHAPFGAIPQAAYDAILEQAHVHGLDVQRRKTGVRGSPVAALKLTIRAKPRG
jgi:hypothetical protein